MADSLALQCFFGLAFKLMLRTMFLMLKLTALLILRPKQLKLLRLMLLPLHPHELISIRSKN